MVTLLLERRRDGEGKAREFCVGSVSALQDIPTVLDTASIHYCLFLAVDATLMTDEELSDIAKLLLERGVAYFCVWGPDCERAHDLFDRKRLPQEPHDRVVMTTWHSKDSLPEALWFFRYCAEPAEGFAAHCRDWIALSVANVQWAQQIRMSLIETNV